MRKTLVSVICLLLIVTTLAIPVLAASSVSISLKASSTTVNSGDTVTVTVSAKVDACKSGSVQISYSSSVFELVSGEWLIENTIMQSFNVANSNGVFALSESKAISGNVLKITLKVKDSAAIGSSKVTVNFTGDSTAASKSISLTVACAHKYSNSCDTTCNSCGAERSITHTWDSGKVTKKATCTATGTKTYTCTVCGKTKTEEIAKKSHSWDDGKITKEATCTATGTKTYTCTVCGKTKTEEIAKKAHTYDNGCDNTCNVCDATRETKHDYQIMYDLTSHWEQCSACGDRKDSQAHSFETELSGTATGHGYKCSTCGLLSGEEKHSFEHDCDTTCDTCGYERSITHNYSEMWSSDENGHWHGCTVCGDKLEMFPHEPGPAATETTDQICIACGYVLEYAGNHEHSILGDWLMDDNSHWFQCVCGEFTDPEEHTFDEGTIDEAAGTVTHSCTVCGWQKISEYVPPTTQPSESQPTQPENTEPEETKPSSGNESNNPLADFPWWIVLAVLLVISVGFNIYLLICLFASKKTGKFTQE